MGFLYQMNQGLLKKLFVHQLNQNSILWDMSLPSIGVLSSTSKRAARQVPYGGPARKFDFRAAWLCSNDGSTSWATDLRPAAAFGLPGRSAATRPAPSTLQTRPCRRSARWTRAGMRRRWSVENKASRASSIASRLSRSLSHHFRTARMFLFHAHAGAVL